MAMEAGKEELFVQIEQGLLLALNTAQTYNPPYSLLTDMAEDSLSALAKLREQVSELEAELLAVS